jgi:hypothetical protein
LRVPDHLRLGDADLGSLPVLGTALHIPSPLTRGQRTARRQVRASPVNAPRSYPKPPAT